MADFQIDWNRQTVTCPQGKTAQTWRTTRNVYGQPMIGVDFNRTRCPPCPCQKQCTRSKRGFRSLAFQPQEQQVRLEQLRQAETSAEFRAKYAKRSGIEGTISQGVRAFDLRRSRYVGLAKTHLQQVATATAINFHRLFDWLSEVEPTMTRITSFAQLAPEPALIPTSWRHGTNSPTVSRNFRTKLGICKYSAGVWG